MLNLQEKSGSNPELQRRFEIKQLVVTCLILIAVFSGIKLGIYAFLHNVPEGFFRVEKVSKSNSSSQGTPDYILSPRVSTPEKYLWQSLPGVAPAPVDNPLTQAKIDLGKQLFFDKNLSADRSLSCASCHELEMHAGGDGARVSTGIMGQKGDRNAPTVWNAAFQKRLFWDGRARSLEQQAVQPFLNPIEMGMNSEAEIEARVKEQPSYTALFAKAFDGNTEITIDKIAKAIASYERTLITNDSPYDEFVRGDKSALTSKQLSGMALFEEAGCIHCHFGPNFSAASVFNSGLELRVFPGNPDQIDSNYSFALDGEETSVWRVPSLRNVALTGPWLHNGQVDDLNEVVRIMSKAQLGKSSSRTFQWADNRLGVVENPDLTEQQVDEIVAFLKALSSKRLVQASLN
ncbi:MAG: cytochrome-c peroxidase [Neptuniibacter sp.]